MVSREEGGGDSPQNLVPACGECNRARADGCLAERLVAEGVRLASAVQRVRRQLRAALPTRAAVALAHTWYGWLAANRAVTKAATLRWRARLAERNAQAVAEGLGGTEFPFGFNAPG